MAQIEQYSQRGPRRWPNPVPRQDPGDRSPPAFAAQGHFAGDDETCAQSFLDIANDESYDAVWFARGGPAIMLVRIDLLR